MPVLQTLRQAGVSVQMQASTADGMPSMKAQFKRADASGARYALVFGADELLAGQVTIKSLRDVQIPQLTRALSDIASWASSLHPSV
jgi:histidyl-tRNA synthetase